MADNPPLDQPATPPLTISGPDGEPIILSELRWPFEELGGWNVPETLPVADARVSLVVAMLAAMRDGKPSLVQYDDAGRALATGDRIKVPDMACPPNVISTKRVAIPSGSEALEIKITAQGWPSTITTVQVSGVQTGWTYYPSAALPAFFNRILVPMDAAQDTAVDVIVNNGHPAQPTTAQLTIVKAVDEVTILSNPGQEPQVRVLSGADYAIGATRLAYFRGTVAAAGFVNMISGFVTQEIRLYTMMIKAEAIAGAPVLQLMDDLSNVLWSTDFSTSVDKQLDFHGYRPGSGRALRFFASALTPTLDVTMTYTQG